MTFLGLLVLHDPVKPDAEAAVSALRTLGVGLKVITGDNALVATQVAVRVGMRSPVVLVVRTRGRLFASPPSRSLLAATAAVIGVTLALPFTPLGAAFGFTAVPARFVVVMAGIVLAYVATVEIAKGWFYRRVGLR